MAALSDFPRTLTQMLRDWDDAALTELLISRPDLALPPPTDLTQIASRATTRHSVSCALDTLNAFELEVGRRASAQPVGFAPTDLLDPQLEEGATLAALRRIQCLALLWGDATSLRPVRAFSALLADLDAPRVPAPRPPDFPDAPRQPLTLVDKVAAGSAFEFVRRIDVLVEHCDHQPIRIRQAGGFTSREVKAVAALLDVPTAVATVHVEVAEAAGLLGLAAHGADEALLPTAQFDAWQRRGLTEQWASLAAGWIEAHAASGPAWLKRLCLQAYGDSAEGRVLSISELRAWVAWHRPRRAAGTARQLTIFVDQASWLGVTGLGAVASFAPDRDSAPLEGHLPVRTEHVLVQADLTAVAPGPLTAEAARDLGALADVESRGGATVYRFTAESLKRAFGLGWDAAEIIGALEARSRTALPQPLRYLVHDLARRRTDTGSKAQPTGDAHSAASRSAGASAPPGSAFDQAAGESSGHRTPPRGAPRMTPVDRSADDRLQAQAAAAIVAQLRQGDAATPRRSEPGQEPTDSVVSSPVDALREAVETGEVVWVAVVDAHGVSGERLLHVTEVADGELHARDARCNEGVTLPVRRITAAHILRRDK